METEKLTLVFVHGYSVSDLETYGELPLRLKKEAEFRNMELQVEEVFLSKYVSFQDEVRLRDISRAFETAVHRQLAQLIKEERRFVCITHSTGGTVLRDWFQNYHGSEKVKCLMSHLIMLAPPNFGSALAQLGKSRLSRLKTWFQGTEPGQGVLDWLELGSSGTWQLNMDWLNNGENYVSQHQTFPFVLSGQCIDRKLYDHLNSYTGELGSDGVIRLASANLNARHILLSQKGTNLSIEAYQETPVAAFRIISGKSHGGEDSGIMKSVRNDLTDEKSQNTVDAILRCIQISNSEEYKKLCLEFSIENDSVQEKELVETEVRVLKDRFYIHDRYFQIIFKVVDEEGYAVNDFDLLFTGPGNDPDNLPEGFFKDRQRNYLNPNTITYYFNYDLMTGSPAIFYPNSSNVLREAMPGIAELGVQVLPRPQSGFVRYAPCSFTANSELMEKAVKPNSTTLLEIKLQRLVSDKVFQLEELTGDKIPKGKFDDVNPGEGISE